MRYIVVILAGVWFVFAKREQREREIRREANEMALALTWQNASEN